MERDAFTLMHHKMPAGHAITTGYRYLYVLVDLGELTPNTLQLGLVSGSHGPSKLSLQGHDLSKSKSTHCA